MTDRRQPSPPHAPGRATSTTRGELFAHWFGSVAWNGLFGTTAVLLVLGRMETGLPLADGILLTLAALGPLLLGRALWETVRAWRFRGVSIELAPAEGSLGGELGGTLRIPVRVRDVDAFRVAVSCIAVEHDSESTRESVVWTAQVTPGVQPAAQGTRLTFAVPLPDYLPPTSGEAREDGVYWAVRVTGDLPGVDLDAAFRVPVARHPTPLVSPYASVAAGDVPVRDLRAPGLRVDRDAGAVVFRYGAGRSLGMGLAFFLFGGVFAGSGAFAAVATGVLEAWTLGFQLLFQLVGALFLAVFVTVGVLLLLLGLWLMTNTLRVEVTPDRIRARRRLLLLSWEREVATRDIQRLEARVTSQAGMGPRASVGYHLRAHTAEGRVTVGDGIRGPEVMAQVARILKDATGLEVEYSGRAQPSSDSS